MSIAAAQITWKTWARESTSPLMMVEASLLGAICIAVLNFGGTEPVSFAVVEVLLLGTGIVALAVCDRRRFSFPLGMLLVPSVLVGWILLQLCPLATSWAKLLHVTAWARGSDAGTITIEPFATRVQLLILVASIVVFFLAFILGQDARARQHFAIAIIVLGLFEAFYGYVQYLSGWQQIFGYVKKYDLQEATGTYINRNHYAGLLEMVLPFALAFAAYEFGKFRERHPRLFNHLKRLVRRASLQRVLFWLSLAAVLFGGIVCSKSRMGILSALLSSLLLFALTCTSRFGRKVGLGLGVAFLIVSLGLGAWIGAGPVLERFKGIAQEYSASPSGDYSRLSIWGDSVQLIRQHPWVGTGFGTFPIAFTAVQTSFLGQFVNHAHNDYLELASDLGIPAAFALVVAIVWILSRAVRTFRTAENGPDRFLALGCAGSITAILLHSFTDFNLYIPANCLLFASILGFTMGLCKQTTRDSRVGR